jgi:hypothetical protein
VTCDDGNACTSGDKCSTAGVCLGQDVTCADDGNPCTDASCDTKAGCQYKAKPDTCAVDGACVAVGTKKAGEPCRICLAGDPTAWSVASGPCDDGDTCTTGDACDAKGLCTGTTQTCDDGNACTLDACVKGACTHANAEAACNDGNACTVGDTCKAGQCLPGEATVCNDGVACTKDACDPKSGCSAQAMAAGASCVQDKCLIGATCTASGQCLGGSPKVCEDGNPCTDDSCKTGVGCVHKLNELPCDDGVSCSFPDKCTGGVCIGVKSALCPNCKKVFGDIAGKLSMFQMGASGEKGQGIDVDGNPKTCAPASKCNGGIDNAAGVLAPFLNPTLVTAVQDGSLSFVAEFDGWVAEGVPFTLNLYDAVMTTASKSAGCQKNADVCHWLVTQDAFSPACTPKFTFKDAVVKGGKLVAGGAGTLFAMDAALVGAKGATLYVKGARIEGEVTFANGKLSLANGILGGAVPQKTIIDLISALDPKAFPAGLTKEAVLDLVQQLLELDVDVDGDGDKDAASIGLRFNVIGAVIDGVTAD